MLTTSYSRKEGRGLNPLMGRSEIFEPRDLLVG